LWERLLLLSALCDAMGVLMGFAQHFCKRNQAKGFALPWGLIFRAVLFKEPSQCLHAVPGRQGWAASLLEWLQGSSPRWSHQAASRLLPRPQLVTATIWLEEKKGFQLSRVTAVSRAGCCLRPCLFLSLPFPLLLCAIACLQLCLLQALLSA
jgi:hypothetical protein